MKKCDCLNFCGDDTNIDPYSESCVDYHNRRAVALKWLADYVPCWDPTATYIMRCSWHAVGYLFFGEQIGRPHQGFLFSLEQLNRERVRIGKTEFTDIRQEMNAFGEMCKHHMSVKVLPGGISRVSHRLVSGDVEETHAAWGSAEKATEAAIHEMSKRINQQSGGR